MSRESRTARLRSFLLLLLLLLVLRLLYLFVSPRRPSFPALVRATSTLDLEHVLHTTRHLPRGRVGYATATACMQAACMCTCTCIRVWLARPLAFFLAYVRFTSAHRDVSPYTRSGRRERRWRRLILPRAKLFRKAKDDKGRSESSCWLRVGERERQDRTFIPRQCSQERLCLKITTENWHNHADAPF